ncbi:methyltransferase domain-containing protein [Caballeronia sp. LjRoot31]|uniref:methyltransferase domain-containing protein n=1 Tax=Caballeronia sp. LjRoot31 TaxID=3342324 RepID=UPI003ED067D4
MSTPATKAQFRKLNIGCGWDKKEGFINADLNAFHSPDVVADACDLSMFEDGSFDYILAQDILEHMERAKTVVALKEWSRLLSPGGHIDIRVPSLFGMFELLSKPENRAPEKAEQIIHLMYGTQAYNGDYHLAGFTAELLVEYLKRAGLAVRWAEVKDEWLFDLEVVKASNIVTFEDIVHNAYFEVLGRPVDGGGLLGWVDQLKGGASADQIRGALLGSAEFQAIETKPAYHRYY